MDLDSVHILVMKEPMNVSSHIVFTCIRTCSCVLKTKTHYEQLTIKRSEHINIMLKTLRTLFNVNL